MVVNWMYVGLAAGLVYLSVVVAFAWRRSWTWMAMGVAIANFSYVLLHLVAPFRGVLDPNYVGYRAGALDLAPGWGVTVVTGAIVLGALAAACVALRNRPGRSMAFIALVDTALLLAIGLPETITGLLQPDRFRIELGEYLQIPGVVAVLVVGVLFCAPLVASVVWSLRRARLTLGSAIPAV